MLGEPSAISVNVVLVVPFLLPSRIISAPDGDELTEIEPVCGVGAISNGVVDVAAIFNNMIPLLVPPFEDTVILPL